MKPHWHTIECYARNAIGPLAYTPCRADGLDRNLKNLKKVDFHHDCKGLTLTCGLNCECYVCRPKLAAATNLTKTKECQMNLKQLVSLAQRTIKKNGSADDLELFLLMLEKASINKVSVDQLSTVLLCVAESPAIHATEYVRNGRTGTLYYYNPNKKKESAK